MVSVTINFEAVMKFRFSTMLLILIISLTAYSAPGDILKEFSTPERCPTGLTYDGKYLWLADRLSDNLYALDPAKGELVKSLPAPGFIPLGLAWDGKYLWVLDGEENRLNKLDLESGITLKSIECPTNSPQGLTFDGKDLWLSDDRADELMKISAEDGTIIDHFKSPAKSPTGLAWDGKYIWCADRIADRIYMIETEHGEVLLSIAAPGNYARGLTWVKDNLWNADYESDKLFQLVVDDGTKFITGDWKTQELTLIHEFRNYGPGKVKTMDAYFALPVNRPNQMILSKLFYEPEPVDFVIDRWGQRFAHFQLKDVPLAERNWATMQVKVKLGEVRWFVFPDKVETMKDIPQDIRDKYLVDEDKYRKDDPVIQTAVKEAVGDEIRPYWIMRKIYKYVRDQLYYELAGGWNVAPAILERGNGSCSEFSFVFISLCRAAGLPTKYVGSVVIRGDDASTDDVFHRWCECFLPGYGWVPVDPSGGDHDSPARVAEYFGHLANRFLITTEGGGASEYLGWNYNANEFWTSEGPVKVHVETIGEWSPVEE